MDYDVYLVFPDDQWRSYVLNRLDIGNDLLIKMCCRYIEEYREVVNILEPLRHLEKLIQEPLEYIEDKVNEFSYRYPEIDMMEEQIPLYLLKDIFPMDFLRKNFPRVADQIKIKDYLDECTD
jgi:hypothetical protein